MSYENVYCENFRKIYIAPIVVFQYLDSQKYQAKFPFASTVADRRDR